VAIRFGTLWERSQRRRASRSAKSTWGVGLVCFAVVIVLSFVTGDVRRGLTYSVLTVVFGASIGWSQLVVRRTDRNLAALRRAAEASGLRPLDSEALPTLPPRRWWLIAIVVCLLAVLVGVWANWLNRPRPECRTVDATVGFVYEHTDVFDADTIGPGGPPLADYQSWSDQLVRYADDVSAATDLGPALRRIADASRHAVATVRAARISGPGQVELSARQQDFRMDMQVIVDAEHQLIAACRQR
jgi:hypothetical protein